MILIKLASNDTTLLLIAIVLGLTLGIADPALAVRMKPLSDTFLMVVGHAVPAVMFVLVASAVTGLGTLGPRSRWVGRVIGYFQLMTLLSLLTGAALTLLLAPGAADLSEALTRRAVGDLPTALSSGLLYLFGHVPILPVLLAALFCGLLLGRDGAVVQRWRRVFERVAEWLLKLLRQLLRLAPLAAFGAVAFSIGRYGPGSAWPLLKFVGTVYLACLLFLGIVMASVARCSDVALIRLITYVRGELYLVASTGSSVAAIPGLVAKLERAGCCPPLVRLVLSTGYTFNLAGSNLYLACALVFVAQQAGVSLGGSDWLVLLAVALLTSLGSTSAAGSAFLTLTATVAALNLVPLDTLGILLGVERLMKCRSLTNVIGNTLACVAISAWTGTLDRQALRDALDTRRGQALPGLEGGKR
ncbi:cation:dicarboxylate symporter family transporter [Pseudomonas sp. X10]